MILYLDLPEDMEGNQDSQISTCISKPKRCSNGEDPLEPQQKRNRLSLKKKKVVRESKDDLQTG